ncbi:hypothetical protein [Actinomadura bangladeshensis]|uniref:Uncharacterized protein n=1 Tax=Actinomadura bangladeshensis TaxID=453573 RepID=A0A6L9QBT7_9ACTN|nr:hypothetical protein [Actinomadura bangladeshensis]NEA21556.1 hypothetical protein [Actinomadura bangladeshensis]NEA22516.1 hypothetical protein [Actinomadura bangladeshensis]
MTIVLILGLVLAVAVAVTVGLDLRAAEKKLRGERMRADASAEESRRLKARVVVEEERRSLAVIGYRDLLTEVKQLASHLEANHEPLVARRLHRLVDDRLGKLRRAGL